MFNKNVNHKKKLFSQKSENFENIFFLLCPNKKMPFSQFCQLRRLVLDQRSPVQSISDSWGGPLSLTHRRSPHVNLCV